MREKRRKRQRTVPLEPEAPDVKLVSQLAVRVPGELALRLRKFCQDSGRSFNQAVAEALDTVPGSEEAVGGVRPIAVTVSQGRSRR